MLTRPNASIDRQLLHRVRGEFLEMPGMRLTFQQAQRLWGIDEATCECLLETLVKNRFLTRGDDQRYGRSCEGLMKRAS